jgi:modification methylase
MKAMNDDLQMRSDWYFPLCTGAERLRGEDGSKLHPTQKPEALLHRVILSCTQPGRWCSTPSSAPAPRPPSRAASAAASSASSGRRGMPPPPAPASRRWSRCRKGAALALPSKREQPRIAFGVLVERGMIPAGSTLTDRHRRWKATVGADGTLRCGSAAGSIHKVGAELQSAPSCNGWTFWFVEGRDGRLRLIDELRQEIAAAGG